MPTERVAVANTTAATANHQRREFVAVSPFGPNPAHAPTKAQTASAMKSMSLRRLAERINVVGCSPQAAVNANDTGSVKPS